MVRRGLALDQCKLVSWASHEHWVRTLLQSLTRDCPSDFCRPNVAQIVQADREAFLIMASELRDLRPAADGVFPMSRALDALRTDPRITMFLMAMPFRRTTQVADLPDRPSAPSGAATAAKSRAAKHRERAKRKRETEAAKVVPTPRADKGARVTPPAELAQCYQKTEDGKPSAGPTISRRAVRPQPRARRARTWRKKAE